MKRPKCFAANVWFKWLFLLFCTCHHRKPNHKRTLQFLECRSSLTKIAWQWSFHFLLRKPSGGQIVTSGMKKRTIHHLVAASRCFPIRSRWRHQSQHRTSTPRERPKTKMPGTFSCYHTLASRLVRSPPDRVVLVRTVVGDIKLCSWARHFTLTVTLSTQVTLRGYLF